MSSRSSSSSIPLVEKQFPRLWNLTSGRWMVITDLHGDGRLYERYRNRFLELYEDQKVDGLIMMGDLIHRDPYAGRDGSLEMVLDLISLQQQYGDRIIYLCGNHELPHIYTFPLSKGNIEHTPAFEQALTNSGRRAEIITFFKQLPFYLRTPAGVGFAHAGAFAGIQPAVTMPTLFEWDHQAILTEAEQTMGKVDREALRYAYARLMGSDRYPPLARHYAAASDPADPHYDHLIRGVIAMRGFSFELSHFVNSYTQDKIPYDAEAATQTAAHFQQLWDALFTKCEHTYPDYVQHLNTLLLELSTNYYVQKWLITGHIDIRDPYRLIGGKQFRIASGKHATSSRNARYLIVDATTPPQSADDLAAGLDTVRWTGLLG